MRDHRKLQAFQIANEYVLLVYKHTGNFPKHELFGLTSQFRRAAVSVPANIVEGCARETHKEYVRFLSIAFGSLRESGYYIELSKDLGYLGEEGFSALYPKYEHCCKVLSGLITSLTNHS